MGNKWVHRLEWYDKDTLKGKCAECGPVDITKRMDGQRVSYRCAVGKKEQKGVWNPLNKKYGYKTDDGEVVYLTRTERLEKMREFGDVCAICGTEENLRLDHCHSTGKFRGVLCNHCNTGLGAFRDSPEFLMKAVDYLAP